MSVKRSKSVFLSLKNESKQEVLVWKHNEEDFNTGSILTVMNSEVALFISEGKVEGIFSSPGKYELKTNNHFFTGDLRNLLSQGQSIFRASLYFIRLNESHEELWGFGKTSPIALRDPVLKVATEITGYGSYRFCIEDGLTLLNKLLGFGTDSFSGSDLTNYFSNQMRQTVKSIITTSLLESNQELLGISARLEEFAQQVAVTLTPIFQEYGLKLTNFSIGSLDILKNKHREQVEHGFAAKKEAELLGSEFQKIKNTEIGLKAAENENGAFMGFLNTGMAQQLSGNLMQNNESTGTTKTLKEKILELKEALEAGLISQAEFDAKKKTMIDNL